MAGKYVAVIVVDEDRYWTGDDLSFSPSDAHFFHDENVVNVAAAILHAKYKRPVEIRAFEEEHEEEKQEARSET